MVTLRAAIAMSRAVPAKPSAGGSDKGGADQHERGRERAGADHRMRRRERVEVPLARLGRLHQAIQQSVDRLIRGDRLAARGHVRHDARVVEVVSKTEDRESRGAADGDHHRGGRRERPGPSQQAPDDEQREVRLDETRDAEGDAGRDAPVQPPRQQHRRQRRVHERLNLAEHVGHEHRMEQDTRRDDGAQPEPDWPVAPIGPRAEPRDDEQCGRARDDTALTASDTRLSALINALPVREGERSAIGRNSDVSGYWNFT